jgi:hypothetical protein
MATRLYFASGHELTVSEPEDDVALAVRRDHPNPVRLGGSGAQLHVNWDHVEYFSETEASSAA